MVNMSNNGWKVANFQGLTMGSSSLEDVLRILGKPDWEGFPDGVSENDISPTWWMEYKSVPEMKWQGKLTVMTDKRKGTVLKVIFYPLALKKSEIIDYLGKDYVVTRYTFEPCDEENGGVARIYESKNGQLEFLEYRSKGIAVSFDSLDEEKVSYISYVSVPIGAKTSQCESSNNSNK